MLEPHLGLYLFEQQENKHGLVSLIFQVDYNSPHRTINSFVKTSSHLTQRIILFDQMRYGTHSMMWFSTEEQATFVEYGYGWTMSENPPIVAVVFGTLSLSLAQQLEGGVQDACRVNYFLIIFFFWSQSLSCHMSRWNIPIPTNPLCHIFDRRKANHFRVEISRRSWEIWDRGPPKNSNICIGNDKQVGYTSTRESGRIPGTVYQIKTYHNLFRYDTSCMNPI